MRRLLAAFLLLASGSLARAGELVEFTDGTKLTVESHWNDGDQVHLMRGGVDMTVAGSSIIRYSSSALSFANTQIASVNTPQPVSIISLVNCAEVPAGSNGCPS